LPNKKDTLSNRTGRRKTSIARVKISTGKTKFMINGKDYKSYFGRIVDQKLIEQPFDIIKTFDYEINVNVRGGGLTGQAGAIRHGVSRALVEINDEFKLPLKKAGLLTRDAREKERKKYGLRGARRAFQFSKR
tara:strand:- start:3491 stop:3889 length:399 start_codon:yes stop_codon:yes gene_type:complete